MASSSRWMHRLGQISRCLCSHSVAAARTWIGWWFVSLASLQNEESIWNRTSTPRMIWQFSIVQELCQSQVGWKGSSRDLGGRENSMPNFQKALIKSLPPKKQSITPNFCEKNSTPNTKWLRNLRGLDPPKKTSAIPWTRTKPTRC